MIHQVIQVYPQKDFTVYVYFADGSIRLYDMSPFLGKGVFKAVSDPVVFIEKCTVMNHTLAWDLSGHRDETKCIDVDPETLFSDGKPVSDPLKDTA